jgi:tetratricopeptide (TPR) repeat protein
VKTKRWQIILLGALLPVALGLGARAFGEVRSYHRALALQQQAGQYLQQGRRQEALDSLQQAIDAYPHFLDLYQDKADIHIVKHQWKEALACWDQALKVCPEGTPSLGLCRRQRALILTQMGRFEEARLDARAALSIDPHDGQAAGLLAALEKEPHP